jgi:hypothetical protein
MEIKVYAQTVEQYLQERTDFTMEDIVEWYGEEAVKLFWAEAYDETGSFAGVQYKDGSYSVFTYGDAEEEYITFGHMLEVLVGEFTQE